MRLLGASRASARTRSSTSARTSAGAAAMKLIDDDALDEPLLVDRLRVLEEQSLASARRGRCRRAASSSSLLAPRRVAFERVDDLRERRLQRIALVARVPDQREAAAGSQDAVDLAAAPRPRRTSGTPAPTVTASTEPSCSGMRSAVPPSTATPGTRRSSSARISRHRLDRDHVRAARHEQPRQLARAGGEVEHGAARAQVEPLDDPRDRRGGIVGPPALVDVGGGEAARRRMQLRHGSTGRGR